MQYICSEQIEIKLNCKFGKPACEGRLALFIYKLMMSHFLLTSICRSNLMLFVLYARPTKVITLPTCVS